MTSKPIVTTTKRPNPNQPSTMAEVPTPLLTLPFPSVCTMVLAATDAVCCHSTETSTKIAEIQINDRAICDTGRDGNGLISRSEPVSSTSSCHPGNVASKIKQKKASIIATMLLFVSSVYFFFLGLVTHIKYGKTTVSLNIEASQITLRGSWSSVTTSASAVALALQINDPPSG